MNGQSAVQNNGAGNGHAPIMVVAREAQGFRVYAASNPQAAEYVSGTPQSPTCTCADFRTRAQEWGYRCTHIQEVYRQANQMPAGPPQVPGANGAPPAQAAARNGQAHGPEIPVQLVLKRSASPDGRIDSLSVEVHQTVALDQNGNIAMQQAVDTLTLENRIIGFFRQQGQPQGSGNGYAGNGQAAAGNGYAPGNEAVPADMTHIGGTQTKRGYSLYINVRVNGQEARLFGSADKLAGYISDAGYQPSGFHIVADTPLRLRCRVVLNQRTNSKYPVIDRVLPQGSMAGAGRGQ